MSDPVRSRTLRRIFALLSSVTLVTLWSAWACLPEASAKVIDRNPMPEPPTQETRISVSDAVSTEGDMGVRNLLFTLRLSAPSQVPVWVDVNTADRTATVADRDYEPFQFQIRFDPGETERLLAVLVRCDNTIESTESFALRLSNAQNATIATPVATGWIVNDDLPSLSIAGATMPEGNGGLDSLTFALALSAPSPDTIRVRATTSDSTARAGEPDYYATSTTIVFPPGSSSAVFKVAVIGDKRVEADECLLVHLSDPQNAALADRVAEGMIVNDDLPAVSVADVAVAEGDAGSGALTFRVALSAASSAPVAFHYETIDGTALASNSDYAPLSGDTLIAAGATSIDLPVTVLGDTLLEGNERFTLRLSAISGATPSTFDAVGTIANDERVKFARYVPNVPMYGPGTLPPSFGDLNGDGLPDLPMYTNTGATFVEMPGFRALLGSGNYHGSAWCDFDRDGDMDLVQMPYGQTESPDNRTKLFVNSNGTLSDIAPSLGMDIMGYGETPNWGDFNADGWPDLFLPFYAHVAPSHSFLFMNQGGTGFVERADSAGIALRDLPAGRRPEGTSVVDWNGDGTLDIYCGNHLFLNDGNARFTDVRAQTGLPQVFDEGSQFVDYDDDGDFDLYLRTSQGPTLYRNDSGQFTNVTASLGIGFVDWEWGDRWADLDGDGDQDLLYFPPTTTARLVLNQGDGTFKEDTTFRGTLSGSSLCSFADIDGDGDLDIAVGANGRQIARNLMERSAREFTNHLRVRVEDEEGRLVMHGATVRLRSLDDPRHPVQSRIVDGGSGYLGQDEYTITFFGLGSGAYDLEVTLPSKPGGPRVIGPAQDPALGGIRPGLSGPQLIVVRPGGAAAFARPSGASRAALEPLPDLALMAPSPNPSRSMIRIGFSAQARADASLAIHDIHGRCVRLFGAASPGGSSTETLWDLCDGSGRRVPAGIYFARLSARGGASTTKRIVVLP